MLRCVAPRQSLAEKSRFPTKAKVDPTSLSKIPLVKSHQQPNCCANKSKHFDMSGNQSLWLIHAVQNGIENCWRAPYLKQFKDNLQEITL